MSSRIKRSLIVISAVVAAAAILSTWMVTLQCEIPVPDEKAAAMSLLAEKLSGSRYFNASWTAIPEPGGPWIGVEELEYQEDRVILERHWGPGQRAQLDRLISQLSEPRAARMVGGYRIPLERLNLALDVLK